MRRIGLRGIVVQFLEQGAGGKDVVAHRGVNPGRISRDGGRVRVFLMETDDPAVRRGFDYPKFTGIPFFHRDGRNRHLGALPFMKLDHVPNVHPVDVVGSENDHQVRVGLLNQVRILQDRIGRPLVPGLPGVPHLRGHRDDKFPVEQPPELPTIPQMLKERLALELNQHIDGVDAGIDEIAEDKIDDAILAPKWYGRLCPLLSQRVKSSPLTACEHNAKNT